MASSDQWAVKKVNVYYFWAVTSPRDLSSSLPHSSVNAEDAPYSERKTRGSKQLKGLTHCWKTGALKSHLDLQMTLY